MTRSRKTADGSPPKQASRRSRVYRPRLEALEDRTTPAFPATIGLGTLTATTGVTLNGFEDLAHAGSAVAGIGDINGDGYADFAVAAPQANAGGTGKGQVYVVYGNKTGLPPTLTLNALGSNGFTITGLTNLTQLGSGIFATGVGPGVAGLGDVNGDGIDDFVVGAQNAAGGKGQAYVIFGSKTAFPSNFDLATLNGANGFSLTGATAADAFGASVGGAGDFNGDGLNDIVVSSPLAPGGGTDRGSVYVVFGSKNGFPADVSASTINGTNGVTINGVADNDQIGNSVAGADDVNGDGFSDVVIGARKVATNKGAAYVVFGGKTPPATISLSGLTGANGFSITGTNANDQVGWSVSGAGDMNGDGLSDVVVGAPGVATLKGAAYVVFGSKTAFPATVAVSSLNGTTGFTINGIAAGDELGWSVAGGKDINSDTLSDIVVGAPGAPTATFKGAAYVIFGSKNPFAAAFDPATLNGQTGFSLTGINNSDWAGYAVGMVGDVNGDGASEVLVGAPNAALGGTGRGQAFVVYGQDTNAPTATVTSAPDITRDTTDLTKYLFEVTYTDGGLLKASTLGDANVVVVAADGTTYPVTFVSAVPDTDSGTIVATYQLNPLHNGTRFTPADRGTYTIKAVANQVSDRAGNFVAEGNIGSFKIDIAPAGQTEVGRFAVGSGAGGNSIVTVRDNTNTVVSTTDVFPGFTGGVRVAEADVNGDGISDLIVGTGPGIVTQVKIISGKDGTTLFTVQPFEATFTGGVYVAAGDINGDGKADVIVTPDEGGGPVVAVYDGAKIATGTNGDAAQIVRFLGIEDPNFRGGARASSADMDGDGLADLVVAAGFGGGPRIAVFNGKSIGGTGSLVKFLPDFFVFEQTLRNGVFITFGDITGDGFADVIAGGGPGGGPRVFALSGKDLLTGTQTQVANFFAGDTDNRGGIRLTTKDLDGDAKSDIITGAGENAGSQVTAYAGKNIATDGTPSSTLFQFDAIPGFANGVYVG
jgi:hypothetical protein